MSGRLKSGRGVRCVWRLVQAPWESAMSFHVVARGRLRRVFCSGLVLGSACSNTSWARGGHPREGNECVLQLGRLTRESIFVFAPCARVVRTGLPSCAVRFPPTPSPVFSHAHFASWCMFSFVWGRDKRAVKHSSPSVTRSEIDQPRRENLTGGTSSKPGYSPSSEWRGQCGRT